MKIITNPDKLRIKCRPVLKDTNMSKVYSVVNRASHIMLDNGGCGLAANQVGSDRQWFLALIEDDKREKSVRVFFNPTITSHSDTESDGIEGCLSFPNKFGTVTRWDEITLRYMLRGKMITETFAGQNARIIQHEVDHLNGILCMDKARNVYFKEPGDTEEVDIQNAEAEESIENNMAVGD